jgi:hypothetical protein
LFLSGATNTTQIGGDDFECLWQEASLASTESRNSAWQNCSEGGCATLFGAQKIKNGMEVLTVMPVFRCSSKAHSQWLQALRD